MTLAKVTNLLDDFKVNIQWEYPLQDLGKITKTAP